MYLVSLLLVICPIIVIIMSGRSLITYCATCSLKPNDVIHDSEFKYLHASQDSRKLRAVALYSQTPNTRTFIKLDPGPATTRPESLRKLPPHFVPLDLASGLDDVPVARDDPVEFGGHDWLQLLLQEPGIVSSVTDLGQVVRGPIDESALPLRDRRAKSGNYSRGRGLRLKTQTRTRIRSRLCSRYCSRDLRYSRPHSLLIRRNRLGHQPLRSSTGTETAHPPCQPGEERQASGAGVLLLRRQVEEHVRLEQGAARMVDCYQLVIDVRADLVERDLSG